jgi:amidohydrolase
VTRGAAAAGLRARAQERLARELPGAIELRRRLHEVAEVAHREDRTRAALSDALGSGEWEPVAGGKSLLARSDPGRVGIVLRAEMDALPIEEESGAPYACRAGAMHACGHDVHMAALVAAFRALRSLEDAPPFAALFQHSEEAYPSGALEVVEAGALAGADAVVAAHVHPEIEWGAASSDGGAINAASDFFDIAVRGRGGHAAYPHRARDAIAALCHIVGALEQAAARAIDPTHGSVLSVGFVRGGSAHNALPDGAAAGGTFRTLDERDRERMAALVESVAHAGARLFECEADVSITFGEPPLVNDDGLAAATRDELRALGVALGGPLRSLGSDDFGYFSERLPSLMVFVGVGGVLPSDVGLHHPRFLPPDDAVRAVATAQLAGFLAAARAHGAGPWA